MDNATIERSPATDIGTLEYSVCPTCHTADATITTQSLADGESWRCGRCQQNWTQQRLATAAAYEAWAAARLAHA
jgi:predicted Zn finger-like uncharacterized protein